MFRIAAIRQVSPEWTMRNVVHIFRVAPSGPPAISYLPSAIATPGAGKRTVSTVIVRVPGLLWDEESVPRTISSRPFRHSPDDVS